MERFVERALVLSTVDYGDADRLVTLFTERRGKLTAFARAARKSKKRFLGALEPGTLIRAYLFERRGATFGIERAEVEAAHLHVREDLAKIARLLYAVELCRELVRDQQPHPELFQTAAQFLQGIEQGDAGPTSLIEFELHALACAGLRPRFDRCCLCEGALGSNVSFDPEHGGAVCGRCRGRVRRGVALSVPLAEALLGLQTGGGLALSGRQREEARSVLDLFIAHQLGKELRAVEFLHQVGLE